MQQSCWAPYVTFPDADYQLGDVCNMSVKAIPMYSEDDCEINISTNSINSIIQKYGLRYTST
jgi:hypothetical protein